MKFTSPRGMRDFYPHEKAWHNHLLDTWRRVSVRNGFEHVDGPIFESLDLYKVKSGEGIVSELFSFRRQGGKTDYAIRPEFTPTLARMVAQRANSLPTPIKWFSIPNLCRAEKPQRGRLREHWQWNVDIMGLQGAGADAEVMFTAIDFFRELNLGPEHLRVKISHRQTARHILSRLGVVDDDMLTAFDLLDKRDKIPREAFVQEAAKLGLDEDRVHRLEQTTRMKYRCGELDQMRHQLGMDDDLRDLAALDEQLHAFGIAPWCEYDLGIVRGLAYYTGTVFEIHEISGAERAVAGGGRYDKLIELFGGPSIPAVGFGMGDVVISLVLDDKNLLRDDVAPRPDAFVFALTDAGAKALPGCVAMLRRADVHTRFSYRTTRNVGRLLKEADAVGARYAVLLDDDVAGGTVQLKDLSAGGQEPVAIKAVADLIRNRESAQG